MNQTFEENNEEAAQRKQQLKQEMLVTFHNNISLSLFSVI